MSTWQEKADIFLLWSCHFRLPESPLLEATPAAERWTEPQQLLCRKGNGHGDRYVIPSHPWQTKAYPTNLILQASHLNVYPKAGLSPLTFPIIGYTA